MARVIKTKVRVTTGDPYTLAGPPTPRKNNGGHYNDVPRSQWSVQPPAGQDYSTSVNQIPTDAKVPGLTGVFMRYYWRELEGATPGNYLFKSGNGFNINHRLYKELQYCIANDLQFVVFIEDKTFNGNPNPLPAYMVSPVNYAAANSGVGGGWTAFRYSPYVQERKLALHQALGGLLDPFPNCEGVACQETALGLGSPPPNAPDIAYSDTAYYNALVFEGRGASAAFPTSRYFFYQNYFPSRNPGDSILTQVFQTLAADVNTGVVMGGPDTLPIQPGNALTDRVYPRYNDPLIKGKIKVFCSSQQNSYKCSPITGSTSDSVGPWYTPKEIYEWARDNLGTDVSTGNYFVWTQVQNPAYGYSYTEAADVIAGSSTINRQFGHYVSFYLGDTIAQHLTHIDELSTLSYVKGAYLELYWNQVESNARGTYNWSVLDQFANRCAQYNMPWMLELWFRRFGGTTSFPANGHAILPTYLDNVGTGPLLNTGWSTSGIDICAKIWEAAQLKAYTDMWTQVVNRYGSALVLCSPSETAMSVPNGTGGYSPALAVAAWKSWMKTMRAAAPTTAIRLGANFMSAGNASNMYDLYNSAHVYRVCVGGPDVYPIANGAILANDVFKGTNAVSTTNWRNNYAMPWVAEVQGPDLGGNNTTATPNVTPAQLYNDADYGQPAMAAQYWIWRRNTINGNPATQQWTSIKAFLASINGAVNNSAPYGY